MKRIFLLLFTVFLGPLAARAEANFCPYLFEGKDFESQLVEAARELAKMADEGATGGRQETKYTVDASIADKIIGQLKNVFGERLELRDPTPEGFRNVTVTSYMPPISFNVNRRNLNSKIRFRKYFQVPESADLSPFVAGDLPAGSVDMTPGYVWVESKTKHEIHLNTVNKSRAQQSQKDFKEMEDAESYVRNRDSIFKRMRAISSNLLMVEQFFKVFDLMVQTGRYKFGTDLINAYERFATKTILRDRNGNPKLDSKGKPLEVQITFDKRIIQKIGASTLNGAYDPSHVVIEVKIPILYKDLTAQDIEDVPDLFPFLSIMQILKEAHDPGFEENRGKRSRAVRVYLNQTGRTDVTDVDADDLVEDRDEAVN